jgi:hypothetical protein
VRKRSRVRIPPARIACDFYAKNAATCDCDGDGPSGRRWLAGEGLPGKFFFAIFFRIFSSVECNATSIPLAYAWAADACCLVHA